MRLMSRVNPAEGFADLWHELRRPNPYRWPILAASFLATFSLIWLVARDHWTAPPPKPKIIYITTFAPGRSDAEIEASNVEYQKRKELLEADEAMREEKKKELYRMLGRAAGMDVDKIERDAAAQRAREEAATRARLTPQGTPSGDPAKQ